MYNPHQRLLNLPSFHPTSKKAYVELLGRDEKRGILASHNIAKSKTGSKEMQAIHFDQEVQVCGN
jgi:hypothetical protein